MQLYYSQNRKKFERSIDNMKKKYNRWVGEDEYRADKCDYSDYQITKQQWESAENNSKAPFSLSLDKNKDSGFCFGINDNGNTTQYVGFSQGTEGNILIAGGNGSGKSASIIKPTLATWSGALCATDVKGELSDYYAKLHMSAITKRPYKIFNPFKYSLAYDPFFWLRQDKDENLISNIWEIVLAITPDIPNDNQPFWNKTEQGILAAAIHYYLKLGLNFSDTMIAIASASVTELTETILHSNDDIAKMYLGEIRNMKPETLVNFDRGLRNKLMLFATDPYINNAFRVNKEESDYFTWQDLDEYNIFLQIPEEKIEQWSGAINLMYTQLIRYLERRSDQYSPEGTDNIQTLLLMDEFARFGKLPLITDAISTLRNRNVNICIVIQSLAQLDKIYGQDDRKIILDNCQFQAILRANDTETQQYFSSLIGTKRGILKSVGESWDVDFDNLHYSKQASETLESRIPPHEFSSLNDVLLLTPLGFYRINKIPPIHNYFEPLPARNLSGIKITVIENPDETQLKNAIESKFACSATVIAENKQNKIKKIPSIKERITVVKKEIEQLERKMRIADRNNREIQERRQKRQYYLIGELVSKYFPEVLCLNSEQATEDALSLKPLESFLSVLSTDQELVHQLKQRANDRAQNERECVSGHEEK